MNISDVAAKLGVNPQTVRLMLQQNLVPFGTAFKREGSKHWSYVLFPAKVEEYVGVMEKEGTKENET